MEGMSLGGGLVLVSACLTVSPLITGGQAHTHTPLIWVGDHNQCLLIYIFGNLCTSISQCDSATWDDNNVGLMSLVISFHQDVPLLGGTI